MKCKFHKKCTMYKPEGACCSDNKLAKNFYGHGRPAGCYRRTDFKLWRQQHEAIANE